MVAAFDSGGSSRRLHQLLNIPPPGDLRNRILSLADPDDPDIVPLKALLDYRFAADPPSNKAREELQAIYHGCHPLVQAVPVALRQPVVSWLAALQPRLGPNFSVSEASVGNLAIAGAYLASGKDMQRAAKLFADLVRAKGRVFLATNKTYHLVWRFQGGGIICGQHRITQSETPLVGGEKALSVTSAESPEASEVTPSPELEVLDAIRHSTLLIYGPGSF